MIDVDSDIVKGRNSACCGTRIGRYARDFLSFSVFDSVSVHTLSILRQQGQHFHHQE